MANHRLLGSQADRRLDPWVGVNLSMFWPGLGQFYAGQWGLGLGLLLTEGLLLAIAAWSIFSAEGDTTTGLMFIVAAIALYGFGLLDVLLSIVAADPNAYPERIPRRHKNVWFAVVITRVLPGLGHFYQQQFVVGLILFTLGLVGLRLQVFYWPLLFLNPLLMILAVYHGFQTFLPKPPKFQQAWLSLTLVGILGAGLVLNLLPKWVDSQIIPCVIPTPSMAPTLIPGDRVFVHPRADYVPQRLDIVVFYPPEALKAENPEADYFIKRIIALPGETIQVLNREVYIDGQPLAEDYLKEAPDYVLPPFTVPLNHYFVLGDNRNDSVDSHIWGPLPRQLIVGKAFKIYWPLNRVRSLLSDSP
ncbi:MAG: hypothetical protein RLZZ490_1412 [Cyanobacteriota bacterium]